MDTSEVRQLLNQLAFIDARQRPKTPEEKAEKVDAWSQLLAAGHDYEQTLRRALDWYARHGTKGSPLTPLLLRTTSGPPRNPHCPCGMAHAEGEQRRRIYAEGMARWREAWQAAKDGEAS